MRMSLNVLQAKQDIQQAKVDLVAAQKRRQQLEVYEVSPSLVRVRPAYVAIILSLHCSLPVPRQLFSACSHALPPYRGRWTARHPADIRLAVSSTQGAGAGSADLMCRQRGVTS